MDTLVLIWSFSSILGILCWWYGSYQNRLKLPSPGAQPLIGHTLQYIKHFDRIHDYWNELAYQAGDGQSWSSITPFQPRCIVL